MKAGLRDGLRGKNVVVEICNSVSVASFALQRFSETAAAAKLPQVCESAKLIENLAVVQVRKFVIDARRENMIALRCAYQLDERSNSVRGYQRGR